MSIMPQENCILRKMVKEDLAALLVIESASQGAPWTEETFKTIFETAYDGWVLEVDGKVVGYIVVGMQAEECHILNLCIARDFQRLGHGSKLLEYALTEARKRHISIAYLEVRRSNSRAIALYTRHGFVLIGERREYYHIIIKFKI
jgi:ribosomal-protein-alanine N-acetyltransferase